MVLHSGTYYGCRSGVCFLPKTGGIPELTPNTQELLLSTPFQDMSHLLEVLGMISHQSYVP